MTFNEDLLVGELAEEVVADALQEYFNCSVHKKKGKFKGYDLYCMSGTIEVKYDKQWQDTGNIAIEFEYNYEPSGIEATEATHWVYLIGGKIYICKTDELKNHIRKHGTEYRKVNGGDNKASKLILMPLKQFYNLFTRVWNE